jgi:exodeoxyribonuclease V beta subunit
MQPFNLLKTKLVGTHLIEAGAGTGKTYTITGIYLRLILEKKIPADQILVVTFTKAATEELKERVRRALNESKRALNAGKSKDAFIDALINTLADPKDATERIQDALRNFDTIAIYTIHGFCHRLLYEHAFETGGLFDTELIADQTPLIVSIAEDFWRHRFYKAPLELISFALSRNYGPHYYYSLIKKGVHPLLRIVPEAETPALPNLDAFRCKLAEVKTAWSDYRDDITVLLKHPSLNGTVYGSLKPDTQRSPYTKRDIKVMKLMEEMDRFTAKNSHGFPAFKSFEKFTAGKIEKSIKKGQKKISHEFFDLCEEFHSVLKDLENNMQQYLVNLGPVCLEFAEKELSRTKGHQNVQFFDDLLQMVFKALNGRQGSEVADKIRTRYHAALVDEFQDTDLLQFEIFSRIFSHEDSLLFMIGDPKQSIYSFRGADVFSYMKASATARKKHTLLTNYRSAPDLVQAVNTVFSNTERPFVFDEIPFESGTSAKEENAETPLGEAPLTIWWLPCASAEKPITVDEAVHRIARSVTGEILCLTSHGERPTAPGDIAVLVRTNKQADIIKAYLSADGIPSVLYNTGNVFDSHEAMELERVLTGIANCRNPRILKAAILTDIMGTAAESLDPEKLDAEWWDTVVENFMTYRQEWGVNGFIRMFAHFMRRENVRSQLLSFADGERRLTNLLHLSELLHTVAMERGLGIAGLLKWLAIQRDPQSPRLEEDQLRLESDGDTVKIITTHKSKGLEYPVVFCPFAWGKSKISDHEILFHDVDVQRRLTLDLGSDNWADHRILAQNELLSENLRLLYVSLTRAQKKCYLAWGKINTAETSAMSYLFHGLASGKRDGAVTDPVGTIAKKFHKKKEKELWSDLKRLEARSDGSIEVRTIPPAGAQEILPPKKPDLPLFLRQFSGRIDKEWRISSYTSLISGRTPDHEMPDHDALERVVEPDHENGPFSNQDKTAPTRGGEEYADLSILSFPRGAAAGIFFHDLFENLDFIIDDIAPCREMTVEKLKEHGFALTWQEPVLEMIQQVRTVPLESGRSDFTLSSVPMKKRLNELGFFFPLARIDPGRIRQVFMENSSQELLEGFPEQLDRLAFAPTLGFMRGYVDMVFEYEGKYFIVDWKSNFLGPAIVDYGIEQLKKEMVRSFYTLQYHLYVLAVHQFLKRRKPGYDYDRDFGGVFYFFIRGIEAGRGLNFGIFSDRPSGEMVDTLGRMLIPGYSWTSLEN